MLFQPSNYVISLTTANERRQHILKEFSQQGVPFKFFDAVSPQNLQYYMEMHFPNLRENQTLSLGEKACLMSHLLLWEKCIMQNLPYITIYEDDIFLGENSNAFLKEYEWLTSRFNLNDLFIIRFETTLMDVKLKNSKISKYKNREFNILQSKHFGTGAYLISKNAAKFILAHYRNLKPSKIKPVDEFIFNELIRQKKYYIYQLTPAICIQDIIKNKNNTFLDSHLQNERQEIRKENKPKKLLDKIKRGTYKIYRIFTKPYRWYNAKKENKNYIKVEFR